MAKTPKRASGGKNNIFSPLLARFGGKGICLLITYLPTAHVPPLGQHAAWQQLLIVSV